MSALKIKLLALIREAGPISLAHYTQVALTDPQHGYYMGRDPLGRDFVTAPEISQIFGELIGLYFVQAWEDRGRPAKFRLVELGPGRGTLMADLLRAARVRPEFLTAAEITLVEASPCLRARQAENLRAHRVTWTDEFATIAADAPLFLIANEFFDALPIHQFVRQGGAWHERMVSAAEDTLIFVAAPDPVPSTLIPAHLRTAPEGAIFETSPACQSTMLDIAQWLAGQGGAALLIDYGHSESGLGDTFQAVQAHRFVDVLAEPGEADLTAHVDFAALVSIARQAGAHVQGPLKQAEFLGGLGIFQRAARLKASSPEAAADIDAAVERLTGPAQMGGLFKALLVSDCVFSKKIPPARKIPT